MASDPVLLSVLTACSTEHLLTARTAAERALATTPEGTQRDQIEAALKLLNEALDAQADADHHDDSVGQ